MRETRGTVERVWAGAGVPHRIARGALAPLALAFRGVMSVRNALYDLGVIETVVAAIPVISVGNLSVGGTGKTPMSSWIAEELLQLGERPAIVLRGYGDDEPLVHRLLNPGIPVIVSADRAAGVAEAAGNGSTIAVLDDAFQHRGVARSLDLVLVSAEDFTMRQRVLPAGPWRESLPALSRASATIITRKAATDAEVQVVTDAVRAVAPGLPIAVAAIELDALRSLRNSDRLPLGTLAGRRILAIAAIAHPGPFIAQLEAVGAICTPRLFADHHPFSADDIASLAAQAGHHDVAVCTLKDAVKLDPRWPRAAAPAWYVSQRVVFREGGDVIRRMLDGVRATIGSPTSTGNTASADI